MTERLYYEDAYLTRFMASAQEVLEWQGQPAVVLDRSAFYPEGGGQPADRGILGGVRVTDVVVRESDGAVVHVLEQRLALGAVEGQVDWPRRFDHMQQHSGQHLLSAAFEQLFDSDTVGFHLGADLSTVDIALPSLDAQAVERAEWLVNGIIWENRPVRVWQAAPDELAGLPLRRAPTVEGPVRLVEVQGFDLNPCGGTHVARTGEIGLLKVVRRERRGNDWRLEFVCGGRALRDYQAKHEQITRLAARLSVGYWETEQAVERYQNEVRQLRRELQETRKELWEAEAAALAREASAMGPLRPVWQVWQGRSMEELRALATALTRDTHVLALLAAVGERTQLCFARGEEVDLDVAALLRAACQALGGKGGGQPQFAQGSAPATEPARVRDVLSGLLSGLGRGIEGPSGRG